MPESQETLDASAVIIVVIDHIDSIIDCSLRMLGTGVPSRVDKLTSAVAGGATVTLCKLNRRSILDYMILL